MTSSQFVVNSHLLPQPGPEHVAGLVALVFLSKGGKLDWLDKPDILRLAQGIRGASEQEPDTVGFFLCYDDGVARWFTERQAITILNAGEALVREARPALPEPLRVLRWFVTPRQRRMIELIREDLREDLHEMKAAGCSRSVCVMVIWWRTLTEIAPFFWKAIGNLLPQRRQQ